MQLHAMGYLAWRRFDRRRRRSGCNRFRRIRRRIHRGFAEYFSVMGIDLVRGRGFTTRRRPWPQCGSNQREHRQKVLPNKIQSAIPFTRRPEKIANSRWLESFAMSSFSSSAGQDAAVLLPPLRSGCCGKQPDGYPDKNGEGSHCFRVHRGEDHSFARPQLPVFQVQTMRQGIYTLQ